MTYIVRFAALIEALNTAKEKNEEVLLVRNPKVLGDIYDELVESLDRISEAGLSLGILPPENRCY